MAHPRRYRDDDPRLARVRPLCLALPETIEVEAWGRPTFRAGRRIFVVFGGPHDEDADPDGASLTLKPAPPERPALLADPRFFVPPYFGPAGWVGLDLRHPTGDGELRELIEASYRQVALRRMLTVLDAG